MAGGVIWGVQSYLCELVEVDSTPRPGSLHNKHRLSWGLVYIVSTRSEWHSYHCLISLLVGITGKWSGWCMGTVCRRCTVVLRHYGVHRSGCRKVYSTITLYIRLLINVSPYRAFPTKPRTGKRTLSSDVGTSESPRRTKRYVPSFILLNGPDTELTRLKCY